MCLKQIFFMTEILFFALIPGYVSIELCIMILYLKCSSQGLEISDLFSQEYTFISCNLFALFMVICLSGYLYFKHVSLLFNIFLFNLISLKV